MKNKIIQKIVFCIPFFLSCGTAFGFSQVFPADSEEKIPVTNRGNALAVSVSGPSGSSSINIKASDAGIILKVENSYLADVLQQVANETNIQFNIGSQLTSHRITVNIRGPNWNSVIETLLKDFSRVTVWNEKSEGMKEVLLLGKNNWDPKEAFETGSYDNRTMSEENRSPGISVSQLKRLVRVPLGNSLPPSLFADQEIRRYLKLKGIQSPEEWEQPKKARTALHMAKKELTRLLYEKQRKFKAD